MKPNNIWGETFKELLSLRQSGLVTVRMQQLPLLVLLGRTGMRIQLLPTAN